jgi:uncharacterized protein
VLARPGKPGQVDPRVLNPESPGAVYFLTYQSAGNGVRGVYATLPRAFEERRVRCGPQGSPFGWGTNAWGDCHRSSDVVGLGPAQSASRWAGVTDVDPALALARFLVGIVVGLSGMGGGALMTPVLVLFFGVQPLAAVSSDLVAAAVMKPVGGAVHVRRGTVNLELVKWLCFGSIPTAFTDVLLLRMLGDDETIQSTVKVGLGVALVIAAAALVVRAYIQLVARAGSRADGTPPGEGLGRGAPMVKVRVLPTIAVGAAGGLIVGMTSVGSGSLIIISLLALYPLLTALSLVGTDLVQAVPLVGAAALAHLLFGDFHLDLTTSLLVGCIPGVWIGARLSAQAPGGVVRRALALVLLASGLKLLGLSTVALGLVLLAVVAVGPWLWVWARVHHGRPAFHRLERVRGGMRPTARRLAFVETMLGAVGDRTAAATDGNSLAADWLSAQGIGVDIAWDYDKRVTDLPAACLFNRRSLRYTRP